MGPKRWKSVPGWNVNNIAARRSGGGPQWSLQVFRSAILFILSIRSRVRGSGRTQKWTNWLESFYRRLHHSTTFMTGVNQRHRCDLLCHQRTARSCAPAAALASVSPMTDLHSVPVPWTNRRTVSSGALNARTRNNTVLGMTADQIALDKAWFTLWVKHMRRRHFNTPTLQNIFKWIPCTLHSVAHSNNDPDSRGFTPLIVLCFAWPTALAFFNEYSWG